MNMGPHAANKVAFDPSGEVLAVASNNGSARLINVNDSSKSRDIKVYQDSVQTVVFDRTSEYMVTAGSDGMYQIFQ
ncbi:Sperm-associated antigen 16 protein [Batrachochytrium dendrobatidis]